MEIDLDRKFDAAEPPPMDESLYKGSGTLLFTEDQIDEHPYFLDRLIRGIMVRRGITREYFSALHYRYAVDILGLDSHLISCNKDNLLKALRKGRITQVMFQRTLRVLRLQMKDMVLEVQDIDNGAVSYSMTDLMYGGASSGQDDSKTE